MSLNKDKEEEEEEEELSNTEFMNSSVLILEVKDGRGESLLSIADLDLCTKLYQTKFTGLNKAVRRR